MYWYEKIRDVLKEKVYSIYENLDNSVEELLLDIRIDKSIIYMFKDNNIKEKINSIYSNIIASNLNFYTLDDYQFILKYNSFKMEIPFCIMISKNIDLNTKNFLIYYDSYFSKYGEYTIKFFSKIIAQNGGNTIVDILEDKNIDNIQIINIFGDDYAKFSKITENNIIITNYKYLGFFLIAFIDYLVLIEGKYEKKLIDLVELFIESGKDIYVVPSNIFNKNSYFSNYLIKQGANIILNVNDLKLLLKSNIR